MPAVLQARGWPTELSPTSPTEAPLLEPGSTTLVVLPDTQYYADCRSPHFAAQLRWVGEQRSQRNVAAVLTLGDLTEHNTLAEWQFIRQGFAAIERDLPIVAVLGNHDHGSGGTADGRDTLFAQHFATPPAPPGGVLVETERPGDLANAYYRIQLPQVTLGVLVLEWSPRTASVAWANQVLSRHPRDRVIFITHAYLYHDDTRYDWWGKGESQEWNPLWYPTAKRDPGRATTRANLHPEGAHDGEMLWQQLIKKHAGIFLTLNGHVLVDGTARLTSRGEHGNTVQQVLVNYQMLREGGLGYLRLVELLADGASLRMKTYSPSLGRYATGAEHEGDLSIDPPLW